MRMMRAQLPNQGRRRTSDERAPSRCPHTLYFLLRIGWRRDILIHFLGKGIITPRTWDSLEGEAASSSRERPAAAHPGTAIAGDSGRSAPCAPEPPGTGARSGPR